MISKALGAIVIGASITAAVPVINAADRTPEVKEEHQTLQAKLQQALGHFEAARLEITAADPLYGGLRGQAIEQTDYAIEQTMVGMPDHANKEKGRLNWERLRKEAELKAGNTPAGKDAAEARRASDEKLKRALDHLIKGHQIVKTVEADRGAKPAYFAEEAMRNVRQCIGLPREVNR